MTVNVWIHIWLTLKHYSYSEGKSPLGRCLGKLTWHINAAKVLGGSQKSIGRLGLPLVLPDYLVGLLERPHLVGRHGEDIYCFLGWQESSTQKVLASVSPARCLHAETPRTIVFEMVRGRPMPSLVPHAPCHLCPGRRSTQGTSAEQEASAALYPDNTITDSEICFHWAKINGITQKKRNFSS